VTWDPAEWMTAREAKEILHYSSSDAAVKACQRKGIEGRRVWANSVQTMWVFVREQVEEFARERAFDAKMEAQGKKKCAGCGEWKDRQTDYWKNPRGPGGRGKCIDCRRTKAGRLGKAASPWGGKSRLPTEIMVCVRELIRNTEPVKPEDSLKYACMLEGFRSRGVPPGLSKREAYCSKCTAPRCIHHPEMTPAMVRKNGTPATKYPEAPMAWALQGERGRIHRELVKEELAGMTMASGE